MKNHFPKPETVKNVSLLLLVLFSNEDLTDLFQAYKPYFYPS